MLVTKWDFFQKEILTIIQIFWALLGYRQFLGKTGISCLIKVKGEKVHILRNAKDKKHIIKCKN